MVKVMDKGQSALTKDDTVVASLRRAALSQAQATLEE